MSSSFQILPAIFVLIAEYKIASSFNYFLSQVFLVFFPTSCYKEFDRQF
jgi:hypothetical protein